MKMGSVIVALPKIEDAKHISELLRRRGIETTMICTTAASVLSNVHQLDGGIVISGSRFSDMYFTQLAEYLPKYFEMLLLASPATLESCPSGIMTLSFPIRANDLISTVEMMLQQQARRLRKQNAAPKKRTEQEQNYINNAKAILMERNHMTEQEAFRYIQKSSMDSGTNMVETAQMILLMIYDSW